MNEELLNFNNGLSEVEELAADSRSSWTDNPSSPLPNNEQLKSQVTGMHSPILTNHQLHELVSSSERVIDLDTRMPLPKYISMVVYFTNTADILIRKL